MKYWNNPKIGLLFLIVLSAALLYLRFKPYVDHPNSSYFDLYADGFKNYATTIYHVKYDTSYLHYDGMNYPYGEHVLFTDCQPIMANTLKFISHNIVDISDYTVAVINLTMLFSFLLCSIFLYLIFTRLQLPVWYSIIVALGLTFLSPQLQRIFGHYGLAHSFVVPAVLYMLILFEEKPRWSLSIITALFIIIIAQLHFYLFAISAALITAYFFFQGLRNFTWQKTGQLAMHYAVQVIIPLIFLQIWARWGDTVTDRPALPLGFFDYRAFWEGIFLGSKMPFWQWVDHHVVSIRDLNFENEAFIGTVSTIFALVLIIRWFANRFKKPFLLYNENPFLRNLFPAIFVILLFSFGLPFTIPGLDVLLDYLGPFRQFRGLGRFAWIFYYGWNIIVWYSIYHIAINIKKTWIKYALLASSLTLLSYEAYQFAKACYVRPWHDDRLDKQKFEQSANYWFKNIDLRRYQAVLPVPYIHVGSENFDIGTVGDQLRFSLIPGLHYRIPSMGVMMSRTSYAQTLAYVPIALAPYRPLDFVHHLPNQKPLLVVIDKVQRDRQSQQGKYDYAYLLRDSKLLYTDDLVELHELSLEAFAKAYEYWRDDVYNGWNFVREHRILKNGIYFPDSSMTAIRVTFDSLASEKVYRGNGAFEAPLAKTIPLWEGALSGKENTANIWVYMGKDQYPRLNIKGWEVDKNGHEWLIAHVGSRYDIKVLDPNGWGLVEFPLNLDHPEDRVRLELECKQMQVPKVWVDELLIRPTGVSLFWEQAPWLIYDNMQFELPH